MVFDAGELTACINVSLDDVAAKSRCGSDGAFEIHGRAGLQTTECRPRQCLARDISRKRIRLNVESRQADAVHGDRIAVVRAFGDDARGNHNARVLTTLFDTAHAAKFFNNSREHCYLILLNISSKTSSMLFPVESMTIASSATFNGESA